MGWRRISVQSHCDLLFLPITILRYAFARLPLFLIGEAYAKSLHNISAQETPLFFGTEEMETLH